MDATTIDTKARADCGINVKTHEPLDQMLHEDKKVCCFGPGDDCAYYRAFDEKEPQTFGRGLCTYKK